MKMINLILGISLLFILKGNTANLKSVAITTGNVAISGFVATLVHETARAGVAAAYGKKITEFRPYPHFVDNHFLFGQTRYNERLNNNQREISDATCVLANRLVYEVCKRKVLSGNVSPVSARFLATQALVSFSDLPFHLIVGFRHGSQAGDIKREPAFFVISAIDIFFQRKNLKKLWNVMWGKKVIPNKLQNKELFVGYNSEGDLITGYKIYW